MKDKRYTTVKILIETGHVKNLLQVFDHIPRTVVAIDFGTNYKRFSRMIENPGQFKLDELFTLIDLFEVDETKFIELVIDHYKNKGSKFKKT